MNVRQQALSLAVFATSLLYSNAVAISVTAKAEAPKHQNSTQTMTQQLASSIERIWQVQGKYRIQISQNNGIYNGRIIWIAPGTETKDINNPDENLRSRDLVGVELLKGFTYNQDKKQWTGGRLYAPDAGKTLKAKLWIADENELKVQASMGPFSKTLVLKAVQ